MGKIQPIKGWHQYTRFMDSFENKKHKAMLDNMRHHLKYECLQDPEIFKTLVPDPEYRFYGGFNNAVIHGMDGVKAFYKDNLWDSDCSLVELDIHHCSAGDWGIACDGEWYQQIPGKTLIAQGQEISNPDSYYLSHAHLSWFLPFKEVNGSILLEGEIVYMDEAGSSLKELDESDVLSLEEAKSSWPSS